MRFVGVLLLFACACGSTSSAPAPQPEVEPQFDYPLDDVLRFQHLQAKSTHNSYHVEPDGNTLLDWAYTHRPIDEQFEHQGVRHVELDVRFDNASGVFEVYHLPVIDDVTTCQLLTDCLAAGKAWSDAHRAHHPLVFQLEIKDSLPPDHEAYFSALHQEVLSVWPESRIVTPALVKGTADSVFAAISDHGWPTLGELRGRALFTIDNGGDIRDAYTHDGNDLEGRLMFPESAPGAPYAASTVLNDPVGNADAIAAAVAANMLVRTRADSGGVEAVAGDTSRLEAALASGAHFITTDFPAQVEDHDYWVEIPGGSPSRCNPLTGPTSCTSLALEDPAFVQ